MASIIEVSITQTSEKTVVPFYLIKTACHRPYGIPVTFVETLSDAFGQCRQLTLDFRIKHRIGPTVGRGWTTFTLLFLTCASIYPPHLIDTATFPRSSHSRHRSLGARSPSLSAALAPAVASIAAVSRSTWPQTHSISKRSLGPRSSSRAV